MSSFTLRNTLWVSVVVVGLATPALGAPSVSLERGEQLYESMDFRAARRALEAAVAETGGATARRQDHVRALDLLARCQIAEGLNAEAEQTYRSLLAYFPAAELDAQLSPKILETFAKVKKQLFAADGVSLRVAGQSAAQQLQLAVTDPWRSARSFTAFVHDPRAGSFQSQPLVEDLGMLTLSLEDPGQARWYVEARGSAGQLLTRLASSPEVTAATAGDGQPNATVPVSAQVSTSTRGQRLRVAGRWILAGVATAALAGGAIYQTRALAKANRARQPDQWTDIARSQYALAQQESTVATTLFLSAGAAAVGATWLFVW